MPYMDDMGKTWKCSFRVLVLQQQNNSLKTKRPRKHRGKVTESISYLENRNIIDSKVRGYVSSQEDNFVVILKMSLQNQWLEKLKPHSWFLLYFLQALNSVKIFPCLCLLKLFMFHVPLNGTGFDASFPIKVLSLSPQQGDHNWIYKTT